jgi:hypothetical protein
VDALTGLAHIQEEKGMFMSILLGVVEMLLTKILVSLVESILH